MNAHETHDNHDPDEDLAPFDVNVIDPKEISGSHIAGLITSYAQGDIDFVVLGRHQRPEAAIVPFNAYERLLDYEDDPRPEHLTVVHPSDIAFKGALIPYMDQYARGSTDPSFFSKTDEPAATIMPFATFMRLLKYDNAAYVRSEKEFANTIAERVRKNDDARADGTYEGVIFHTDDEFDQWIIDNFGDVGRKAVARFERQGGEQDND